MFDSYLRFPHLHGDLLTFVAEDDVWIAPVDGGRAWRLSADRAPAANPRFSPDGSRITWTSRRDGAPEVHTAEIDTGAGGRLTYWGSANTRTCTWTPGGAVVAAGAAGEPSLRRSWAHAVPPGGGPATRLP